MAKKNQPAQQPGIPLKDLAERYLHHMETEGRSRGTVFSYSMELGAAQKALGADTPIAEITRADIVRFNDSPRVTLLRSGKPKSQLSIDKTRRVLRLALGFAVQAGLLLTSPAEECEQDAATEVPAAKPARKSRLRKQELEPEDGMHVSSELATAAEPEQEPEPRAARAARSSRKRRGAVTLEATPVAEGPAACEATEGATA